jgi:hypothetical protein
MSTCADLPNIAFASASNAAQVSDPGSILCRIPPLLLNTTQNPSRGKVGDVLNDSAQLSGGTPPYDAGATITFKL